MKVINGSYNSEVRVPFYSLEPGTLFIHSNRVLIKVASDLYRIEHENLPEGENHTLAKVNAIRLGCLDDDKESKKIAGRGSVIGLDTKVRPIADIATLYLQG